MLKIAVEYNCLHRQTKVPTLPYPTWLQTRQAGAAPLASSTSKITHSTCILSMSISNLPSSLSRYNATCSHRSVESPSDRPWKLKGTSTHTWAYPRWTTPAKMWPSFSCPMPWAYGRIAVCWRISSLLVAMPRYWSISLMATQSPSTNPKHSISLGGRRMALMEGMLIPSRRSIPLSKPVSRRWKIIMELRELEL